MLTEELRNDAEPIIEAIYGDDYNMAATKERWMEVGVHV